MITREDIRELAQFQFDEKDKEACALSFYFQPRPPQNKSHREEAILAKDLVRSAMRETEKNGKNGCARADLLRMLNVAENLHGHQTTAKAVFACGAHHIWREFDLPPQLPASQLFVNSRFHLKPLALLLGAQPRVCVALVNRQRARLFDFRLDELKEREGIYTPVSRRTRSDGYAGYNAGHHQRHVADEALHHFKDVAARLKDEAEKGAWEKLIIACQDNHWPEFEPQLHPYVIQRLLGRFSIDVTTATNDRIREHASRILLEARDNRRKSLIREALNQAKSNNRGVTGLRRVLRSIELGEVQTLLMGQNYSAHAVECGHCGHLDAHIVRHCPICGHVTRELEDVGDAVIAAAIRRDIELFYVNDDAAFDSAGNIAALLRFRADQSRGLGIAVAS
jgi:peptide subunit release factor 1 (eRF1)